MLMLVKWLLFLTTLPPLNYINDLHNLREAIIHWKTKQTSNGGQQKKRNLIICKHHLTTNHKVHTYIQTRHLIQPSFSPPTTNIHASTIHPRAHACTLLCCHHHPHRGTTTSPAQNKESCPMFEEMTQSFQRIILWYIHKRVTCTRKPLHPRDQPKTVSAWGVVQRSQANNTWLR